MKTKIDEIDKQLYKKYSLDDEISLIKETVEEMR